MPIEDGQILDSPARFELEPLILDEEGQPEHPLLAAAKRSGLVKRQYLIEHVIPNDGDEVDDGEEEGEEAVREYEHPADEEGVDDPDDEADL